MIGETANVAKSAVSLWAFNLHLVHVEVDLSRQDAHNRECLLVERHASSWLQQRAVKLGPAADHNSGAAHLYENAFVVQSLVDVSDFVGDGVDALVGLLGESVKFQLVFELVLSLGVSLFQRRQFLLTHDVVCNQGVAVCLGHINQICALTLILI